MFKVSSTGQLPCQSQVTVVRLDHANLGHPFYESEQFLPLNEHIMSLNIVVDKGMSGTLRCSLLMMTVRLTKENMSNYVNLRDIHMGNYKSGISVLTYISIILKALYRIIIFLLRENIFLLFSSLRSIFSFCVFVFPM